MKFPIFSAGNHHNIHCRRALQVSILVEESWPLAVQLLMVGIFLNSAIHSRVGVSANSESQFNLAAFLHISLCRPQMKKQLFPKEGPKKSRLVPQRTNAVILKTHTNINVKCLIIKQSLAGLQTDLQTVSPPQCAQSHSLVAVHYEARQLIDLLTFQSANMSSKKPFEKLDKLIAAKLLPWRS